MRPPSSQSGLTIAGPSIGVWTSPQSSLEPLSRAGRAVTLDPYLIRQDGLHLAQARAPAQASDCIDCPTRKICSTSRRPLRRARSIMPISHQRNRFIAALVTRWFSLFLTGGSRCSPEIATGAKNTDSFFKSDALAASCPDHSTSPEIRASPFQDVDARAASPGMTVERYSAQPTPAIRSAAPAPSATLAAARRCAGSLRRLPAPPAGRTSHDRRRAPGRTGIRRRTGRRRRWYPPSSRSEMPAPR